MTFYIRPRQDLSLAAFAQVLGVLESAQKDCNLQLGYSDKDKLEIRLYFNTDNYAYVFDAVNMVARYSNRRADDFKIIEVKE